MLSWFNNFFHFNRRQRRGILQLSLLLTFIIVIKIYMAFSVPDFNPQIRHITLQPDRIPAKIRQKPGKDAGRSTRGKSLYLYRI